jgi:hypothetical protein
VRWELVFGVWEACIIGTTGIRSVSADACLYVHAPFAGGRVQIHKNEEQLLTDDLLVKLAWSIRCVCPA